MPCACWLLAALMGLSGSGCTQRVQATRMVRGPETSQRTVAPDQASPVQIRWWKKGNTLTGRLSWGLCVVERSWTETEQRVLRTERNQNGNTTLMVVGTVGTMAAIVWTSGPMFQDDKYECDEFGCEKKKASPVGPLLLGAISTGIFLGGLLGNRRRATEKVLSTNTEQKRATDRAICARRAALAGLEVALAAESGDEALASARVDERGLVRFELPERLADGTGVDAALVVRAVDVPASAASLISAGQQLGTLALGELEAGSDGGKSE